MKLLITALIWLSLLCGQIHAGPRAAAVSFEDQRVPLAIPHGGRLTQREVGQDVERSRLVHLLRTTDLRRK